MDAAVKRFGAASVANVIDSLPRTVVLSSACSGTGIFELASRALFAQLNMNKYGHKPDLPPWTAT